MTKESKRAAALRLLAQTGMWRSNYEPPLLRLLWRLGFNLPPPHLAKFWSNALFTGVNFATAWGALMWFLRWSHEGVALGSLAVSAVCAGVFFGLAMASYYLYGRRKYKLPLWQDLEPCSAADKR